MTSHSIIKELRKLTNEKNRAGMQRFGINSDKAFGISIPILRDYAKRIKKNHPLALQLWETEFHEARLLAIFVANPKEVTEELMEKWLKDFDSWDICDQCCSTLFDKTPIAFKKAIEWTKRKNEFEKRAGFVMMATLAVHNKKALDTEFEKFFPYIEKEANDERNFVKKAVNWALRQIGKRNLTLNKEALKVAERIKLQESKSAKWIAADAIRELTDEKTVKRIKK